MSPGDSFTIPYPFWRSEGPDWVTGAIEAQWMLGTEYREYNQHDDGHDYADSLGSSTFTVVSIHKPGTYPERVFYVQSFTDPDGHEFSSGRLRCRSRSYFKRLISSYLKPYKLASGEGES